MEKEKSDKILLTYVYMYIIFVEDWFRINLTQIRFKCIRNTGSNAYCSD